MLTLALLINRAIPYSISIVTNLSKLNYTYLRVSVFGSDKSSYESLFPKDSFIHVQDYPKGPESLAKYLQKLDKV